MLSQRQQWRKRSYTRIKNDPLLLAKKQEQDRKGKKPIRLWLGEYKLSIGCVDCGYKVHFAALQLDHMGKKSAEFADIRSSRQRILQEIKDGQCVVRCANCHSIKTWCDKNGISYRPEDYR